ncbi:MAG TPA: alpha/beta fold hydrolase [Polyangiaceae bacterium]|nr:alpha/beta fold hydrolase [Polyangiaceae bacterium]
MGTGTARVIVAALSCSLAGCPELGLGSESTSAPVATTAAPSSVVSSAASGSAAASASAAGSAAPASATRSPDHIAASRAFVEEMGRGDFAAAVKRIPAKDGKSVSPSDLESMWKSSLGDRGAFEAVTDVHKEPSGKSEIVRVVVRLSKGSMAVKVGYGADDVMSRFRILPSKPPYDAPSYVDESKLDNREIQIGKDALALPGTLTLPKGPGPWPVVVFVHGSGGGDRDESGEGGARPFRDIAEGLARKGFASIRWDKRTSDPDYVRALDIDVADFTVDHEYMNDIGAALELAKSTAELDPKKIYVIGHSMGGWLVPWLLERHTDIVGGIILAGNARHLLDLLPQQYEYLAKLDDGAIGPLEKLEIDKIKKQCKLARDPKLALDTPASDLPFGTGPKYWLGIQKYDAVATAKKLKQPLLILQGGRDYQVTEKEDLALWQSGLAKSGDVVAKVYPELNHAFVAGKGMATPEEYKTSNGHVDPRVVEDILGWLATR